MRSGKVSIMENFNEFKFTGSLVRAPWIGDVKFTNRTARKALFSVRNNYGGKPNFVDFQAWGDCAEAIAKLPKGTRIGVVGYVTQASVKQEGKKDKNGKDVYQKYVTLTVTRFYVEERSADRPNYDASADFGQQSMPMSSEAPTPWN